MKVSFAPLDDDAKLVLSEATGGDFSKADTRSWFCCTARTNDGELMGVLGCEPVTPFDYAFSIALPDPACLSPKLLRVVFTTLFKVAARITAHIDPENAQAIQQAEKLGMSYEGYLRRGLDGHRDALIYGMLPEECIWLVHPKHHAALRALPREGARYEAA